MIFYQPSVSCVPGAKTMESQPDPYSAKILVLASYLVLFVSIFLFLYRPSLIHSHSRQIALIGGSFLVFAGVLLRILAVQTLGRMFTITVRIMPNHRLVTEGIYGRMRHPSYTGAICILVAPIFLYAQWFFLPIALAIIIGAYLFRIRVEEALLKKNFPEEYEKYQKKVKALIPYIV